MRLIPSDLPPETRMDAFLEQAQADGTLDSRGVFTINAEKAEVKLAKFQLAKLDQFPKFLLAAGTQAGATRFSVSFYGSTTLIRYDGWGLSSAEFRYIGMQSLKEGTPRPLRYLAVAFSVIGFRYDFSIRSGELQVAFENAVMQFPSEREDLISPDRLEIEIDANLKLEFSEGLIGQQKFCPFPVVIGEKELPGGYDPSSESVDSYAYLCRRGPGLSMVTLNYADSVLLELPEDDGGAAMAISFTHPAEAERAGFWLLVNGLACRAPDDFVPSGFYGVAVANDLELSLSYELISNESYHRFRREVLQACSQLRQYTADQLTGSSDRIYLFMLKSVSEGLEREGLAILQQALPVEEQPEEAISPSKDPEGFQSLLAGLTKLDELRRGTLLDKYRGLCFQNLRQGHLKDALDWHQAVQAMNSTLNQESESDPILHYLLLSLENPGDPPSPESLKDKSSSSTRMLVDYLLLLNEWVQGGSVEERLPSSHVSWQLPLTSQTQTSIPWAALLARLAKGRVESALRLLKMEPSLSYEGNERIWLRYLLTFHRAHLPWTEFIKLRVALSFSEDGGAYDYSDLPLAEARRRVILIESSRPPFWPHFLTLVNRTAARSGERERRACWGALLTRMLTSNYLAHPEASPLHKPFSPGEY